MSAKELNIGDYVRTKNGNIHKITDLKPFYENDKLIEDKQTVYIDEKHSGYVYWQFKEFVIKSSPNIIDLIEENDYVNGSKVTFADKELKCVIVCNSVSESGLFYEKDIKSIVTKEQFESMKYKVE